MPAPAALRRTIETLWRMESARILGGLLRLVRDLDTAEDVAQEALVAALETWPERGIPENPGAWLMTTARHRALDLLRHRARAARHAGEVLATADDAAPPPAVTAAPDDDVLRLMLVACHPVLSREARVALTLRLVGGLTTAELARAFLQPEPTLAQRLVRAKRTLAEARVPFEVPERAELDQRLGSVLDVVYLIFNEGYAATRGERWVRSELTDEALRLGRILSAAVPGHAEAQGLIALLELSASRLPARTSAAGEPIPLLEQARARWDRVLIRRGLQALERADALGAPRGPFTLQAAIAACHARAPTAEHTDWPRIVALYDALVELTGSPVVELNRAMAVGMAEGPAEGLALVEALGDEPALRQYHLLPAVRGELLERLGRLDAAHAEFEAAAALCQNGPERGHLRRRAERAGSAARAGGAPPVTH